MLLSHRVRHKVYGIVLSHTSLANQLAATNNGFTLIRNIIELPEAANVTKFLRNRSFSSHGIGATMSAKSLHSVALRRNRCTVATTAAHCCALIAVQASSLESFNAPGTAAAAPKRACTSSAMAGAGGDLDLGAVDR